MTKSISKPYYSEPTLYLVTVVVLTAQLIYYIVDTSHFSLPACLHIFIYFLISCATYTNFQTRSK